MPSIPRTHFRLLSYRHLGPFVLLALYGLTVLAGWAGGNLALVQPRSYDAVLPANACVCLVFLSLAPLAFALGWRRSGVSLGALGTLLAGVSLLEAPLQLNLGIDNLLINHEALVAGSHIGRLPAALATVLLLAGMLLIWQGLRPTDHRRPIWTALLGSLCGAYGLTGLLGYRTGLNAVEFWLTYAQLGPHTALMLIVLGTALLLLAVKDSPDGANAGPVWLWLPVVVYGATLTITFWIALRQRELSYTNSTTLLTSNNIAALFNGEAESHISSLSRMARLWTKSPGTTQQEWEADAAEYLRDFEGYRSIMWVDTGLHTRWYWPHRGNEDAPLYDHAVNSVRRTAIAAASQSRGAAIAAPLESPLQPPSFAVYSTVMREASLAGFIVGEFYYDKFFDVIDRRLNLSRRYQFTVSVSQPTAPAVATRELKVYATMTPVENIDERLRQTVSYRLLGQHLTLSLAPRPGYLNSNRQYLPELALFSGLGLSALFGLVVNLAQSARRRQRAAEHTSQQLRAENEERRRVEARLQTTDERLNLALDATQVGVYEWHLESDHLFCTPSVWNLIGYDPRDMPTTGAAWLNLLHADDQPFVREVIEAHFRGETPFIEIEHCVLHHSGEWIWIALRAKCISFSAAKRPLRVLGTIQNINARKRADEALRVSQAESRKLSLVASKTDNAVIITDQQGGIEWVNESYSRLTGRRLTEVAHRPLIELLASPEGDPGAIERINAALHEREPVTTDVVQLAGDDRRFHVRLDLQPVISEEGLVTNFIAIETDITSRVETERSLRQAKADADEASRAKSDFLATMSHEIRTPMNGVIGMTSLLLETELTAEQRDYLTTIRTSGDGLLTIINDILDFSKIESGKMELECQPFELALCLEEVINIFALPAAAKNIELAYHIAPAVPACIMGDSTRLRQVLVNLFSNALKFTPRGFITLELDLAPGSTAPGADNKFLLDFQVTDTGIGIPAERLGVLFKPFSQVDSSTTRKYGGTGLGLAISHRLCQLMGGTIDVHSTPGQGSRFHFNIQITAVDLHDPHAPPRFAPIPGGLVLAVDDHPVNRAMLRDALTAWKLQPLLAADATAALQLAGSGQLAAAIIDQNLGDASGLELAAQLHTTQPNLPIIIYTGAAEGSTPPAGPGSPIFRLPKPIKPHQLHDKLRQVIHGSVPSSVTPPRTTAAVAVRLADTIPLAILIVEDNKVNQKILLRYLELMGYRADAAANGREAVQAVQDRNYQLVYMDMQMPEMDGLEATREIRTRLAPERQPIIIALTANTLAGDRERCLAAGMDDFLSKPVKLEEIQATIVRFFGPKPAGAK